MAFETTGLDPRLLRAMNKRGFEQPSPAECIPRALEGRDLVAHARTGSGKTLAYLLPALHRILTGGKGRLGWQALVLVPTRELCEQVREEAAAVAAAAGGEVAVSAVTAPAAGGAGGDAAAGGARHGGGGGGGAAVVATAGQLVVTTPARLAQLLREGHLTPAVLEQRLQVLVLDEADLLLSYGYEEDVQALAPQVPRSCQCLLMSATTSEDVDRLTKLVLHHPLTLNLLPPASGGGEGGAGGAGGAAAAGGCGGAAAEIRHFRIDLPAAGGGSGGGAATAEAVERLLHLLVLLKYGLVPKRVLLFVNSAEAGMRARLFLEAFGLRAALLSAELPLNSRHHILQEFNRGLFDYLIATDSTHGGSEATAAAGGGEEGGARGAKRWRGGAGGGGRRVREPAAEVVEEFGVTRGIDFKGVSTVVNLEPPASAAGYVHRVGRTGRAGQAGTAVTLLAPHDAPLAAQLEAALAGGGGGAGSAASGKGTAGAEQGQGPGADGGPEAKKGAAAALAPYPHVTRAAVDALRYRAEDVARSITKNVIKEARTKELKAELLNSQRLAAFFEEHPSDLSLLRHDKPLAATGAGVAAPHLKHLPAYLRDPTLQGKSAVGNAGRAQLPAKKRRRREGLDPLKSGAPVGFVRAPKRGGERGEEPTQMEVRAMQSKVKRPKRGPGAAPPAFTPKRNVRRGKGRKR
eukprot:scaffold12.g8058.t1